MKRAIREHWKDFAAILALLVLTIAVAGYILTNERLSFPFISPSRSRSTPSSRPHRPSRPARDRPSGSPASRSARSAGSR